jgi:hypothetical protein
MNRKLIVTLLKKEIQELDLMTEGFMEINTYPKALINLALQKNESIRTYISQLNGMAESQSEESIVVDTEVPLIDIADEPNIESEQPEAAEVLESEKQDEIEFHDETETVVETETVIETENELSIEITNTSESSEINDNNLTTRTEEYKKTTWTEKTINPQSSRNELLSKSDNSLASVLANKKITDIRQAINIGDRFRFQRELFRGNGEDMNKTLNYINQLATIDEVLTFLKSKYNWDEDNESAQDFLQIARRKFA